jgi:hypothetical protein
MTCVCARQCSLIKQVVIHNCFRCAGSTQILVFFFPSVTTEQFRVKFPAKLKHAGWWHLPNNLTNKLSDEA